MPRGVTTTGFERTIRFSNENLGPFEREQAEETKKKLEAAGATVELK